MRYLAICAVVALVATVAYFYTKSNICVSHQFDGQDRYYCTKSNLILEAPRCQDALLQSGIVDSYTLTDSDAYQICNVALGFSTDWMPQ